MNIKTKHFNNKLVAIGVSVLIAFSVIAVAPAVLAQGDAQRQAERTQQQAERAKQRVAQNQPNAQNDNFFGSARGGYQCGKGPNAVNTRINFGCLGERAPGPRMSPIEDMIYAFVRFLSYGVGIVLIGSIIWAGIQYSTSEGNPEATQASKNRIRDAVIGLFIYLFAFALVQYLVPGGLFSS